MCRKCTALACPDTSDYSPCRQNRTATQRQHGLSFTILCGSCHSVHSDFFFHFSLQSVIIIEVQPACAGVVHVFCRHPERIFLSF
jgi:hypothetical protein